MASIIEQIKAKIDIVNVISSYIDLHKKGKNYWGLCPFHPDKNPSMSVSPTKQMFKCFVCGKGGNAISFVAEYEQITFGAALAKLAKQIGVDYQNKEQLKPQYNDMQKKLIAALNDASDFFQYSLFEPKNEIVQNYLNTRHLDSEICENFGLGYADDNKDLMTFLLKKGHDQATLINASLITEMQKPFFKKRLIFPIKNQFNDVIAFAGRVLDNGKPKYLNSGESQIFNKSKFLYNWNNAYASIQKQKEVFICEGFMDVIALTKAGYKNTLALMGTALSNDHISNFKDMQIILMLDADPAGLKATLKSLALLINKQINTFVVPINQGKDPDEIFHTLGEDGIDELIAKKQSALEFIYHHEKQKHNLNNPQEIESFIRIFAKYLLKSSDLEKDFYLNKMAMEFKLSKEVIGPFIPRHTINNIALPLPQENKFQTIPKNYSYILIRSMIAKPFLIDILKKHPVHFTNSLLTGIVKYLLAIRSNQKVQIAPEYQATILAIQKESQEKVTNENEFLDLIKIINKATKEMLFDLYNVKLKKASNPADKLAWLKMLKQIKKGAVKNGKSN